MISDSSRPPVKVRRAPSIGAESSGVDHKVKADDPLGIFPMLGVKVHWTSVHNGRGHGQAKPIERAFGIGGLIASVERAPSALARARYRSRSFVWVKIPPTELDAFLRASAQRDAGLSKGVSRQ